MKELAGLAVVMMAGCADTPREVSRDADWDAAFTRTNGWTAGDIANSIDLCDGSTLWLFGDSWIGPVVENRHVTGESVMVRNAGAWHLRAGGGRAPAPREMKFLYGGAREGARYGDWLEPDRERWPADSWLWMMGDGVVVGEAGARRLVMFATVIGPAGNPEGMWNFRRVGGVIFTVRNFDEAVDRWEWEQAPNPLVEAAAKYGEPARRSQDWGAGVVLWPRHGRDARRHAYVYGVRTAEDGARELTLARATDAELESTGAWEFWDGQQWGRSAENAIAIARGVVDEFSVEVVRAGGGDRLVLVQSEWFLSRRILVRTAERPEGPWSEARPVFTVREPEADSRLITYAAKAHLHLSGRDELLVSYVVNSTDFGQVVNDAGLYRPRFLRVPLERVLGP